MKIYCKSRSHSMASGSESPLLWPLSYHLETHSFPYLSSLLEAIFKRTCHAGVQFLPWIPCFTPLSLLPRTAYSGRPMAHDLQFVTTFSFQKNALDTEISIHLTYSPRLHESEGMVTYCFRRIVTTLSALGVFIFCR